MKKNKIPIRLLFGLLLVVALAALSAQASGVKVLTFSSGSGRTGDGSNQLSLTLGQSLAGTTAPGLGDSGAGLGIWEVLYWQFFVSPVGDEIPVFTDKLFGNYPNPFNPSTQISFSLEQEADVLIEVYDVKGRKVGTLLQEVMPAGSHSVTYEPRDLASGVYLVLMRAGAYRASERMLLLK